MPEVIIETAKDGHKVPVFVIDSKPKHLGSMYDGDHMAKVWCDRTIQPDNQDMLLVGLGDCKIALEARERLLGNIYIYEPEKAIYENLKNTAIFKKLSRRNDVFVSTDAERAGKWPFELFNMDRIETSLFCIHPGYVNESTEEKIAHFKEKFDEAFKKMGDLKASLSVVMPSLVANQLRNISAMKNGILLSRLKKKWNRSVPFIIVGAGPSLNKNVEVLKEVGDKACILCLDSAYPVLEKHGIRPHFVASVDAKKNLDVFGDLTDWDIPLITMTNAKYELIRAAKGPIVWGYEGQEFPKEIRGPIGGDDDLIPTDYGVISLALSFALSLEVNQLVFIGLDLSYSEDGRSHSGIIKEEYIRYDEYVYPGYNGGTVYSRGDWAVMKKWLEAIAGEYERERLINATEGGVKIEGMAQMPLSKVVSYLKEPKDDWYSSIYKEEVHISEEEHEGMMRRLAEAINGFERLYDMTFEDIIRDTGYKPRASRELLLTVMKSSLEWEKDKRIAFAKEKTKEYITDYLNDGGYDELEGYLDRDKLSFLRG